MTADGVETIVKTLAEHFGEPLPAEHLAETAAAWRLMAPHLQQIRAAELGQDIEPAALFRP
ncbi:hypothetical protein [Phenylobacterium sp.]|jgi:hypothetical protein|uniref:hypothetical protein n=1 Tax=Phenylobacterium sp. TaxID=1871053 RepID=UPI002F4092AB